MSAPGEAQEARPRRPLSAELRAALAGESLEYTTGSLPRAILLLSVPMMLELSMESVFAVVDVFFVMRLGAEAVAVVGVTEAVLTLLYALAIGLSMGTTAMVARRIGEGDRRAAGVVAVQAIGLGLVASAAVAVAGGFGARRVLELMGGTPSMVAGGAGYTMVIFGGSVTVFQIHLINAVFRGAGDASMAMRSLWLANAINIVLDPCLIFGWGPFPELGLTGAAVATTIGRGTGVVYQLVALGRSRTRLVVGRSELRIVPATLMRLVRLSFYGIAQLVIVTSSWIGLVRIVAGFGEVALAGYTVAVRIVVFAFLPAWGMSNAAATLVGQNLGAGRPDRAERSVWLTSFYNMAFLGSIGLVFLVFAPQLVALFTAEPEVLRVGVECLRIVSAGYLFYAFGMVVTQAFNGAGDTATPMVINFFCFWLFQIPLAWTLAHPFGLGPRGVFVSIAVAETTMAIVAGLVFRRGGWKSKQV